MPVNKTRPIKPDALAKDLVDFAALREVQGYRPPNPAFEVAAIEADKAAMEAAATAIAQAQALVKTKRDEYVAAQWKFHDSMDGGRTSVESQFGKDSNELQAVGRKKTSEYRARTPKPKSP